MILIFNIYYLNSDYSGTLTLIFVRKEIKPCIPYLHMIYNTSPIMTHDILAFSFSFLYIVSVNRSFAAWACVNFITKYLTHFYLGCDISKISVSLESIHVKLNQLKWFLNNEFYT